MSVLSPDLVRQIQNEWTKAFNTIIKTDERFLGSQSNFNAIVAELRRQQIRPEEWWEPVYLSIYMQLKSRDVFEYEKTREQKAIERAQELSARDREAGSYQANHPSHFEETAGEVQARLLREDRKREQAELREAKEKLRQSEEASAVASSFDSLPTVSQIVAGNGEELSLAEQKAMSAPRMREYRKRLARAWERILSKRENLQQ